MPGQGSVEKVIREIDALRESVASAQIASEDEYRRVRALAVLDGVKSILKGCCESPQGSYYEFTFWQSSSSSSV